MIDLLRSICFSKSDGRACNLCRCMFHHNLEIPLFASKIPSLGLTFAKFSNGSFQRADYLHPGLWKNVSEKSHSSYYCRAQNIQLNSSEQLPSSKSLYRVVTSSTRTACSSMTADHGRSLFPPQVIGRL